MRKLLVILGLAAAAVVAAKKIAESKQAPWQSPTGLAPVPDPVATPEPAPSRTVEEHGAEEEPAPLVEEPEAPEEAHDAAGGTLGEAISDTVEEPVEPTTPDAPAEEIVLDAAEAGDDDDLPELPGKS